MLMALRYLCLVLCLALFVTEADGCKEFVAYRRTVTFFQAFQQCRLFGGYLAFIESAEENAQVVSAIKAVGDFTKEWYIGATDLGNEGNFLWFGVNKKATYLNFVQGEPNNSGGTEHCVVTASGKWKDMSCDYRAMGFVCAHIRH
ncbi:perlucin-like protein [Anopheles stephensi]|uniref:perlucin-like protein n=1 Tax=Anopheles stephensi TaxID=30069 RepID=UPI0016587EA2|nr:perlucin-like protein [Anopheles stephensi]